MSCLRNAVCCYLHVFKHHKLDRAGAICKPLVRSAYSDVRLPMDKISKLSADVTLFSCDKARSLKLMGMFGMAQFGLWSYWGYTMYEELRDISAYGGSQVINPSSKSSLWRRINLGDQKYRIAALAACLVVGVTTAFITLALPLRIVKTLVLQRGAQNVVMETYSPFGRVRQLTFPLTHLSCEYTRQSATSYLAIKAKGKAFYFLLDCKGTFHNPQLFDYTVGMSRVKL